MDSLQEFADSQKITEAQNDSIPQSEWLSNLLHNHPDVLETRERTRSLFGAASLPNLPNVDRNPEMIALPSLGRIIQNQGRTEVPDVISSEAMLQLVAHYLYEHNLLNSLASILTEYLNMNPESAKRMFPEKLLHFLSEEQEKKKSMMKAQSSHSNSQPRKNQSMKFVTELSQSKFQLETWIDPIFQKALEPLLALGIKNTDALFSQILINDDSGDREVEASVGYFGDRFADQEEDDVNILDDNPILGVNYAIHPQTKMLYAATLNQVILFIIDPSVPSTKERQNFVDTFLLCCKLYTSPEIVLSKLFQCGSQKISDDVYKLMLKTVLRWISRNPFAFNEQMKSMVISFAKAFLEKEFNKDYRVLMNTLSKAESFVLEAKINEELRIIPKPKDSPPPVLPNFQKILFSPKLTLDDISDEEIARQLCFIDHDLYYRITPDDIVNQGTFSPHIKAVFTHVDFLIRALSKCLLEGSWHEKQKTTPNASTTSTPTVSSGAKTFELKSFLLKLLRITAEIMTHFDYLALFIIYSTFTSTNVNRVFRFQNALKAYKSQSVVSKRSNTIFSSNISAYVPCDEASMKTLTSLFDLFSADNNFENYRYGYKMACANSKPAVPSLLLHLQDITNVNETLPTKIKNILNLYKAQELERNIRVILQPQHNYFQVYHIEQITTLIKNLATKEDRWYHEASQLVIRELEI